MKIGIVTTTYNNSDSILKSIESVINNSMLPNEIIVIDRNSTDKTFRVLSNFFETNDKGESIYKNINIRLYRLQTDNIYAALNIGIQLLKNNDIIGLINPRDVYHKDKIKTCIEYFKLDKNIGAIISDFQIHKNKYIINIFGRSFDSMILESTQFCDDNYLINTSYIMRTKGFDIKEKFPFINLLQKISHIGLVYHIPQCLTTKII